MHCPVCNNEENRVYDVRQLENRVWRRRICLKCKFRYSTEELIKPPSKKRPRNAENQPTTE